MSWTEAPLRADFGAELSGRDIAALGDRDRTELKSATEKYGVVVVRDQEIQDADFRALASSFGEVYTPPGFYGNEFARDIIRISNIDDGGNILPLDSDWMRVNVANEFWHTDSTFVRPRTSITMLYARAVPPTGGETEFCDTRVAFEALPDDKQRLLEGLNASHSLIYSRSLTGYDTWTEEQRKVYAPVERPLVHVHEETGRKALCIASHIADISTLSREDAQALKQELIDHATLPERVYSHHWRPGDLVLWDNRCTMHRARPYSYGEHVRDFRSMRINDLMDR
jgi:alpha-ketoglutarate-dependent 2,4-dichlorophenoxyacetate dioxygenase